MFNYYFQMKLKKSDPPPTSDFMLLNSELIKQFPNETIDDIYEVTQYICQKIPRRMREDPKDWCSRGVDYCIRNQ